MSTTRTLIGIAEMDALKVGLDLVSAARRNLGFLRTVTESRWLHRKPTVVEAIRRYSELWMPLMAHLTMESMSVTTPVVHPPIDIEWVWFFTHLIHFIIDNIILKNKKASLQTIQ